ncbi:Fc.00g060550.m01.CDS01 [Cosmosporella sp. VM-42]
MSSNCDPGSTGFGPQNSFIGTSPLVTPSPFSSVDQPSLRDGRQSQLTPTTPPQIQIQESASTSTILGFAKVSQPRQTTSSQAGNSGPFRKSPASGSRLRRNRVLTEEHVKDKEVIQISFMKDNLEVFFFARCSLGRAHTIADRDFAIGHQLEHHPIPPAKMMLQETVKGMGQPKRYGVFEVPQKIGSVTVKKKLQAQLHNLKGSGVQMDIGRNGLVKLGLITENFGNMHLNVPVSPSNTFGASADGPSATSHVSPASTSQFGMSFGEMSSSAHEPSDGGGWTRLEPQFPEEGLSYLYPPRGH